MSRGPRHTGSVLREIWSATVRPISSRPMNGFHRTNRRPTQQSSSGEPTATTRPRPRIGILLERQPRQHAAHAVPDHMHHIALRLAYKFPQPAHVLIQPQHHRAVAELPDLITEPPHAQPQQPHFPPAHNRAMHKDNNRAGAGRRRPRRIKPGRGHASP